MSTNVIDKCVALCRRARRCCLTFIPSVRREFFQYSTKVDIIFVFVAQTKVHDQSSLELNSTLFFKHIYVKYL